MDQQDALRRGLIVEPRSTEAGVVCGACDGLMVPQRGERVTVEGERHRSWMWWLCTKDGRHVTRAIPLPVQMARSV